MNTPQSFSSRAKPAFLKVRPATARRAAGGHGAPTVFVTQAMPACTAMAPGAAEGAGWGCLSVWPNPR